MACQCKLPECGNTRLQLQPGKREETQRKAEASGEDGGCAADGYLHHKDAQARQKLLLAC